MLACALIAAAMASMFLPRPHSGSRFSSPLLVSPIMFVLFVLLCVYNQSLGLLRGINPWERIITYVSWQQSNS
jgi:hypothetical protein